MNRSIKFVRSFNEALIFSSSELKAQVSFSNAFNLSSVCNLVTFSPSSQEPQGQFQSKLAQVSLGKGDSNLLK